MQGKNKRGRRASKGLGDTIEKITEATGMNILVKLWQLDSRGKERIIGIENFTSREAAKQYITENADVDYKPFKLEKGVKYAQELGLHLID